MPFIILLGYVSVLLILINLNVYAALGFILISSFIAKYYFPQIKGYIGERRVQHLLAELGEEYSVFHDLYVEKGDGNTTQIDHVVVSRYGIFVIETKNYTGWIFGSEKQINWTQTIYKNRQSFYNPILQNQNHIKALQQLFNKESGFISMIVFSDAATFKFKSGFNTAQVIQTSQLKQTISQFQTVLFTESELVVIFAQLIAISNSNKANKSKLKREHIAQLNKPKQKAQVRPVLAPQPLQETEVLTKICPSCSHQLVKKHGRYGIFYGCEDYPTCRYTERQN